MYWSKTWNTQLIYDNRKWFRNNSQLPYRLQWTMKDYPYKYPSHRVYSWTRAQGKNYWNSEKIYAKRFLRLYETPEPYHRHITSFRWD